MRRSAACSSGVARARMRTFGQRYGPPAWIAPAAEDDRRQRAVRPAVHHDLDVLGDERAVGLHPGPVGDDRRMALRRRGEILVAVVDHPDRLRRLPGEERGVEGDDRGVLLLASEPAAGLRLDDPGLLGRQVERPLHRLVDVVRALERAVDGDPAVLARDRDHRVVLDVELLLVTDAVLALEDEVGLGEAALEVAGRDLVVGEHVARSRADRRPAAAGVVRSVHGAPGVAERLAVGRREEHERLGVVLDLAADAGRGSADRR